MTAQTAKYYIRCTGKPIRVAVLRTWSYRSVMRLFLHATTPAGLTLFMVSEVSTGLFIAGGDTHDQAIDAAHERPATCTIDRLREILTASQAQYGIINPDRDP